MFPQSYLTSGVQKLHHKKEGENQQIMMHIFWRKGSLATSKDEKWAALYFVKTWWNHTGLMFIFHDPYSSSDLPWIYAKKIWFKEKSEKVSTIHDAIAAPIQEVKLYGTTEDEKSKWNTSEPTGQLVYADENETS